MLFALVTVKPDLSDAPGPTGEFLRAVVTTGYLWPFIGIFKFVIGILILIPRYNPLGTIVAFPYNVNILLWVTLLATQWAVMGVPVCLASCYLFYAYSDRYKPIIV